MAIPVVEIIMSLRYALGDMQGSNISDYQLIEPINQAASKLYGKLSERFVHDVVTKKEITVEADGATVALPENFNRIRQVFGSNKDNPTAFDYREIIPTSGIKPVFGAYKIADRQFKAAKGKYILEYYYVPKKVEEIGEELEVPESMRTWIEQLALAYYRRDYNTAEGILQQSENVLAGRDVSHFENTSHAQTLGVRGA